MKYKYRVIRAKSAVIAAAGLAICILISVAGGISKSITAWSPSAKHPIYSVETGDANVALTINCAWGNDDIPELLSILKQYNIKATFFIVGDWCDKFPESVELISAAGHEIGSHSDTHADMTRLNDEDILREIEVSRAKLQKTAGVPVTMFRPPSGAYNDRVVELIRDCGMYPVQWDCDSIDYKNPSPETMRERIIKKIKNGSIMLFHSGADNTPAALPLVIEAVTAKGYTFVSMSKLVHEPPYTVDMQGRQHEGKG